MAENGLNPTIDADHHPEDGPTETETVQKKPNHSNGNPFLVDLDESPEHHTASPAQVISSEIQDKKIHAEERDPDDPGQPASGEVLIDFGSFNPDARVDSNPTNAELLGDFDPFQRSCSTEPHQTVPVTVPASDDFLGFLDDGRGDSNPIEVFAVPPPGPPDEHVPEVIQPCQEANFSSTNIPPEVDSRVPDGADQIKVEKNKDDLKSDAAKSERSEGTKDAGQIKAKDRKLPQSTTSPRPNLATHVTEKSKLAEAAIPSKGQAKSPVSPITKSAIPSIGSPKRTLRSISCKGQTDVEKENSRSASQSRGTSRTRTASASTDHSAINSPSPGSTPRSLFSPTSDGRASTPSVKNAKSKIGSLDNAKHVSSGGNVKIQSHKMDLSNVSSKCGSKANMQHTPGGGQRKIESRKLEWKAESKVGSMDNAKHRPGGGERKIENKKLEWNAASRVGSLDNAQHKPAGGDKKIETVKLDFKEKAAPKVGSKDNMEHKAGGGTKKIETVKINFNETAQSKVGSKVNIEHKPGGGDKKIETKKLNFNETATSKIGSLNSQTKEDCRPTEQPEQQE